MVLLAVFTQRYKPEHGQAQPLQPYTCELGRDKNFSHRSRAVAKLNLLQSWFFLGDDGSGPSMSPGSFLSSFGQGSATPPVKLKDSQHSHQVAKPRHAQFPHGAARRCQTAARQGPKINMKHPYPRRSLHLDFYECLTSSICWHGFLKDSTCIQLLPLSEPEFKDL